MSAAIPTQQPGYRPHPATPVWASWMAFILGFSAVSYIPLAGESGFAIKPVTLVPLGMAPLLLFLFPREHAVARTKWVIIPALFIGYMAVRLYISGPETIGSIVRNGVNFIGFYVCLILALAARSVVPYFRGFAVGITCSTSCAIFGITVLGKSPYYNLSGRWEGWAADPNFFANGVGIAFVVSVVSLVLSKNIYTRLFSGFVTVITGMGLIGTASRGGILASLLATLICFAFSMNSRSKGSRLPKLVLASLAGIFVMSILLTLFFDYIPDRIRSVLESTDAIVESYEDDPRAHLHREAIKVIKTSPLIGVSFRIRSLFDGISTDMTPHSTYLFIMGWTGIIGFVLFFWTPMFATSRLIKQLLSDLATKHDLDCGLLIGCLALFYLHGASLDIAEAMHVWHVFALSAYMCLELKATHSQQRSATPPVQTIQLDQLPAIRERRTNRRTAA